MFKICDASSQFESSIKNVFNLDPTNIMYNFSATFDIKKYKIFRFLCMVSYFNSYLLIVEGFWNFFFIH